MTTTRHSWAATGRTDYDKAHNLQIDFCICRVCNLVRVTTRNILDKSYEVFYLESDGTKHERKIPFPCKSHCKECKQEVAFEGLT